MTKPISYKGQMKCMRLTKFIKDEVKTKMEIKAKPQVDVTPYVGKQAVINSAMVERGRFGLFVKLETGAVSEEYGDALKAQTILGFTEDRPNKKFYIAIDSPLHKFIISKQIDASQIPDEIKEGMELTAFHGKLVTCQKNPKGYLEIA